MNLKSPRPGKRVHRSHRVMWASLPPGLDSRRDSKDALICLPLTALYRRALRPYKASQRKYLCYSPQMVRTQLCDSAVPLAKTAKIRHAQFSFASWKWSMRRAVITASRDFLRRDSSGCRRHDSPRPCDRGMPIGVIKRVFGFVKVRYRGLAKNAHHLVVTCALANLFMARRHLLRCQQV
jgi:hypothetical protein